ncbi:MAG: V-type ATP synthase subunit E, partial [Clostridia bacterium]|nr:V-type ATP synthase subunit E [Clostridia bacterium]
DEAFKGALDKLNALDGDVRDGLIESLALRAAHGGEELCPAKADAERAARLLERINAALKEKGKAPLTIGEGADVDGGFLLRGKGYEMNCSFEAMLSDFRQAEESGVAKILFV